MKSRAHIPRRHHSPPADSATAFSLIELMVVIGIIGVVAALLGGAISGARFKGRVTSCANNYRQWGIAVHLYAGDEKAGVLPAFSLPLANFAGYSDLYPWFVSLQMGTNMAPYGVSVPMWFCPARPDGLQQAQEFLAWKSSGRKLATIQDLTTYWALQSGARAFAGIQHSWFVPRPLAGSTQVYPDPQLVKCRIPDGWPTRLDDPSGAVQPILTDAIWCGWNEDRTALHFAGTGHTYPERNQTRSLNVLFMDGRVETRQRASLQWQIEAAGGSVIPY